MFGYDVLILLGFFVGMILYAVLTGEVIKRQNKLAHEYVFLCMMIVLVLWHGFQFFALLIKQVFGRQAVEVYTELRYLSLYSIVFLPALMVHVHSAFLAYVHELVDRRRIFYKIFPYFFYLPIVLIIYFGQYTIVDSKNKILDENMSFIPAFIFYFVIGLLVSAALSIRIAILGRNEKWRKFFIMETVIIFVISALMLYFYFFGGTGNVRLDKALKNMLMASSVLPTGAMIYLLYKYPFYSTMARRRFLLITIAGTFLCVYVVIARALRKMGEDNPDVSVEMLEILTVSLLFLLYEPAKYLIRRIAGYYALNQKHLYQTMVRRIGEKIVGSGSMEDLLKVVHSTVTETFDVDEVAMFILSKHVYPDRMYYSIAQSLGDIKEIKLESIIKNIQKGNGLYEARRMSLFHLKASEIPYHLYLGISLENDLVGLLAIGKKKTNEEFTFEEKEILLTLASQIAIAIENIELVQRRIELESKMFQADKLSSLGLLATSIAHEVKNPLSSIKSIVQSLRDEKKKKSAAAHELQDLEIINDEIDRLNTVVGQLLKFSRPDNSDVDEIDVIKIIDNILTILRQETRSKGIRLWTRYDHTPLMIKSRQGDLKEIIFNVIINAIQSMEHGGRLMFHGAYGVYEADLFDLASEKRSSVTTANTLFMPDPSEGFSEWYLDPLTVQSIQETEKKITPEFNPELLPDQLRCIKIAITDNGPGIKEERMQEIFKPFYTTKSSGTGLGLAIVKNKIEALGGRLVLRSEEKIGTSFEIYIPMDTNV
jgi:signal transduction histidine kinase